MLRDTPTMRLLTKLGRIAVLFLCVTATAVSASAQTYTVRTVRDVPYLQGAGYADDKDKLDIYLPEGRSNAPVIVSYYSGGALRPGGPVYFVITDALAVDTTVDSQRGRLH